MSLRSILLRAYFSQRERAIDTFRRHPVETQARMFRQLLRRGRRTEFGWRYNLGRIRTPEQFASMVETFDYDTFKPYIERMLAGESDVTAPGRVTLFARSSGTTSDRSKYIPVTRESLWWNHTMGMRDVATVFAANNPRSKVFDGKTLTLGGSCRQEGSNLVGDLSALLIHETTFWSGWFRAPKMQTALIADFDRKAEAICRECTGENITAFAGVPSWNLALMRRVLEYTGRSNLLEVWPNLCMFAHGGVEFTPYRRSFEELIPSPEMQYMETYNASEGFFALADDPHAQRHAADARLRHLLRIPPGRQHRAARRGEERRGLCSGHHLEQRAVALRNRRYGGVHLDGPLPDSLCRAYAPVHQRLRRGGDCRQRRPRPGAGLPRDGRRGGRVYGGPPAT